MKIAFSVLFFTFLVAMITCSSCKKSNQALPPTISSISPSSALAGTLITISGSNFSNTASDNTVKFNGVVAVVGSATATSLTVTVPTGGSTGAITVTTTGGTAIGPIFSYLLAPTITSVSPSSAKAGMAITITGTNFDAISTNNMVKFNGMAAVVTLATATTLNVTVPASGSTGVVTVTTAGGTATGPIFTYLQNPTITNVNPASALAGTSVTLTGTNFNPTASNNVVSFNGTAASVISATITQLVVTVPASGTSGNVTVTTPVGISNGFSFTYLTNTGPDLYVLGTDTRFGYGYWKNFVFTAIPNLTSAYAMVGSGNDIYIAGPSTTNTPTYWKNSVSVQVSSQNGSTTSIFISGTDVYSFGNLGNAYYTWKNGIATPLASGMNSYPFFGGSYYKNNNMTVSNGDVYVAGAQYLNNSTILKATYWKNGIPTDLTDGIHTGNAQAYAIYVLGNDIYVAGIEEIISGGGIINMAPRLWKNGLSIPINTPANSIFNSVSSILVNGSDIYLGGVYNGAGAVWKNGDLINQSTYAVAENVSSIFLYNNTDLYITGASSSSGNNCYWKNGNFVEMDPGCIVAGPNCAKTLASQVISIYVK